MSFIFNVITTSGQHVSVAGLGPDSKVLDIKTFIESSEGIPVDMIMLVHGGQKLENDRTLESCHIKAGVTVNMVLSLRAG